MLLIGTTFAWFTDTASTGVNKIQSGNLDVDLEYATAWDKDGNGIEWASVDAAKEPVTLNFIKADNTNEILWEPGCTYKLPQIKVVNKGNLALKYIIKITGIQGDEKLNEVIDWTIDGKPLDTGEILGKNGKSGAMTIQGHMQESAGNEYQNLSIDGISITVYATQAPEEYDSFDNAYDA
ncbi:MAG: SipW-dependent-type signal peptide-containing protein, partial [Eubacteriaceae bacterium]|nr:SipW-dependent-type signal peptide-containing protein [Eubacteriaceae bacterium]